MSVYHVKLLELLTIEKVSEKTFLHIRLSFDQDVELTWEIDNDTADNLKAVTDFDGNYKYRISFQTSWDFSKKQHISFLTRTYRDQSDKIYFSCSEKYVMELNSIKRMEKSSNLSTLSFLSMNLPQVDVPQEQELELELEEKQEPEEIPEIEKQHAPVQEEMIPRKYNRKFSWKAVAMIGVISIILFGYSGHAYLSKVTSDEIASPKAEVVINDGSAKQVKKVDQPPVTKSVDIDSNNKPNIPFVELDEVETYSIPEGSVALTFDDGPSKFSTGIIDVLKEYQVGGTFFFIGLNVKKHPDHVRYVSSNGYSIGSHSMNHVDVSDLSYEKQEKELRQSTQLIEEITNEEVDLFRPPFGSMNERTIDLMKDQQNKMVLWNLDPQDWKNRNADEIVNYVRNTKASGSIILLHESQAVIDALPKIIEYLHEQDLEIVSLK